jgi:hypothetical protein
MRTELFLDSFAAYFKHAPFMRLVNECMLTYSSPDYKLPTSVRPALRGSHIILQSSHSLYTNWAAMVQRTSAPHMSRHDVQIEPGWTGCFWPGHCNSKDKCAFFSYVIWLDHILGTKPNHTRSSASQFCVDRVNNALHYSIDDIRWASDATNFWNKGPRPSSYVSSSNRSTPDLRHMRNIFRYMKRKHSSA